MSKGAGNQTVTNKVDPETMRMQREVFNAGRNIYNTGYDPATAQRVAGVSGLSNQGVQGIQGAQGQYGQLYDQALGFGGRNNLDFQRAGQTGAAALGGDPNAISRLMNPYTQNVVNAVGQQYDQLRNQAALGANDAATRAGAFGGSRHAVMTGERLGQLDQGQAQTTAGLLQQGYNDTMNRAGQAANLGLSGNAQNLQALGLAGGFAGQGQGAAGQLFGMGDYMRQAQQQQYDANSANAMAPRNWQLQGYDALRGGLPGSPLGSTQSQPLSRNVAAGILGGAATGAQIGSVVPGIGTLAGTIGGGLLGMF